MWNVNEPAASGSAAAQPSPASVPRLPGVGVSALYRGARVGGDFFDFATIGERLLLALLDIAGERAGALRIAVTVQEAFHRRVAELFGEGDVNEAEAVSTLFHDLNRGILAAAGGVRCAPGFLACYNTSLGTLCYVNAGHTAGLLRDSQEVALLESGGLPLGLFSHATHDAQVRVLPPGGVLLLVSRGVVEARAGKEEFGLDRVKQVLRANAAATARELCAAVLGAVQRFVEQEPAGLFRGAWSQRADDALGENDTTVLALMRQ